MVLDRVLGLLDYLRIMWSPAGETTKIGDALIQHP